MLVESQFPIFRGRVLELPAGMALSQSRLRVPRFRRLRLQRKRNRFWKEHWFGNLAQWERALLITPPWSNKA